MRYESLRRGKVSLLPDSIRLAAVLLRNGNRYKEQISIKDFIPAADTEGNILLGSGGEDGGLFPECSAIIGATGLTYVPIESQEGMKLRARIRYVNEYGTLDLWTEPTDYIRARPLISTSLLSGLGTTQGQNGWQAGKMTTPNDIASFTLSGMAWSAGNGRWEGNESNASPWISPTYILPGQDGSSTAPRYTFSESGNVTINVSTSVPFSTGVFTLRVWHNAVFLDDIAIDSNTVPGSSGSLLLTADVVAGDTLTFEQDGGFTNNGDLAATTISIATTFVP